MNDDTIGLHAVRRLNQFVDEIPSMWRYGADWSMRFWTIDDEGGVHRVPEISLPNLSRRQGIDLMAAWASAYCAQFKPPAIVLASECWGCSGTDQQIQKMKRGEGGTPTLMKAANRKRLKERYGLEVSDSFFIVGDARGIEPIARFFHIVRGEMVPVETTGIIVSRFKGVLDGTWAVWNQPPGDWT